MASNNDLIKYFQIQRQIFGVCPHTGSVFRLSDCQLYVKNKPTPDWMQKIEASQERIDKASAKLDDREDEIREKARIAGRKEADQIIKKIDKIFHPLKLNPDESKVIFHPVDFIVFNGMKSSQLKNLIFLDKANGNHDKRLQQSIKKTIEKGCYEWVTLRVADNGSIIQE
jgi:predicted Holliday junction resolvase-like endonuclease